jgi:hypothetical protein
MTENEEHELAVALDNYTDPTHPDYDPAFDAKIRKEAPHWFPTDPKAERAKQLETLVTTLGYTIVKEVQS